MVSQRCRLMVTAVLDNMGLSGASVKLGGVEIPRDISSGQHKLLNENIVAYNCRKDVSSSPLMFYQILSIFGLIKEAAAKLNIRMDNGQPEKEELISYIHQHIYEPCIRVSVPGLTVKAGFRTDVPWYSAK